jgi:hypothetical protein
LMSVFDASTILRSTPGTRAVLSPFNTIIQWQG